MTRSFPVSRTRPGHVRDIEGATRSTAGGRASRKRSPGGPNDPGHEWYTVVARTSRACYSPRTAGSTESVGLMAQYRSTPDSDSGRSEPSSPAPSGTTRGGRAANPNRQVATNGGLVTTTFDVVIGHVAGTRESRQSQRNPGLPGSFCFLGQRPVRLPAWDRLAHERIPLGGIATTIIAAYIRSSMEQPVSVPGHDHNRVDDVFSVAKASACRGAEAIGPSQP